MDNTHTPPAPTQWRYDQVRASRDRHREHAEMLTNALGAILAWRILQPHPDAVHLAPLDAILDSVTLGLSYEQHIRPAPATLAEAVAAHREVMRARARGVESVRLTWDQIEAAAVREIDRHMPVRAE